MCRQIRRWVGQVAVYAVPENSANEECKSPCQPEKDLTALPEACGNPLHSIEADFQARVLLKAQNSSTVYGEAAFEGIDATWRKFSANITANATDFQAEVAVQLMHPGSILVDSLSLFPGGNLRAGWQNPYPFRQDLLQHLQDLKPRSAPIESWNDGGVSSAGVVAMSQASFPC